MTVEDDFSSFGKKKKKKKAPIDIENIKQDDGDGTTDDCKFNVMSSEFVSISLNQQSVTDAIRTKVPP